ncbi:MAG: hypothetical protein JWN86_2674 [Planctomycetota bacterium]|nr:hypothetical protein [Planctomycetota bacterium]
MHPHTRRILTFPVGRSGLRALILGLATTPAILLAQEPKGTQAPASGTAKSPVAGTPKKAPASAAPVDPAARKATVQAPPVAKPDPEAERKMDELLLRWERKSAAIKSLSVPYKRVDNSPLFGKVTEFEGQAHFTSANKAYLDFFEVVPGKTKSFDERIVCDGKNVYQFKGATKQIFVFPLPADRREKALQQGPLPFLFNMRSAEAKERYKMILKRDDPKSYQILIIPLLEIDREEYSQAVIRLDKQRLIPTGIHLMAPNGKETKTFTFAPESLDENLAIKDAWFDGAGMVAELRKSGWKVVATGSSAPAQEKAPALGARPAPAAGGRPAMKGQAGNVRQK